MVSKATLGRLPTYLEYLKRQRVLTKVISSTTVSRELDLGEVQVRKDFASISANGKPKTGYNVSELIDSIETVLGTNTKCEAVIVGAGRLGKALLEYGGFHDYGITVKTAFDSTQDKIGGSVLPIEELAPYCALHQVEIGIITVPQDAAQKTAELMVKSGIKAIWCLSALKLDLPDGIAVHYENLSLSLANLKQKIKIN